MKSKFLTYCLIVLLLSSLGSWWSLTSRAMGGQGTGNSWRTGIGGTGYNGGSWGGGGGHK